ncbi:centromere protein J [Episyrphus balteatus]|uniref:centromere protein J n=1 Tax=Episyrphus balteatus TaxID=286459 RepID=UPI0024859D6F|nr:centromere protein J [Episyrphus balteatus]
MSDSKDDSSGIVQRLEELNLWQEEQKRILFEKQNNQRKLLGLEHRKMYETLGIYHADSSMLNEEDVSIDESSCSETDLGVSALDQTVDEEIIQEQEHNQVTDEKPKRPFLRRKQGLINRFKVDPDQFNLQNLPPYKFSSSHPSLKRNVARKPPEKTKPTKEVRPISKAVLRLKTSGKPKKQPSFDEMEEKFQKSLISSQTACNSTPDTKSQASSIKETPEPISWATILDPQNIKPIEKTSQSASCLESNDASDNMSIFELLEQKAKDGSFDLNSSYIKRFLRSTKINSNDNQFDSPVSLKLPPIPYEIHSSSKTLVSDSSETEFEEEEKETPRNTPKVRFVDDPIISTKPIESNLSTAFDNSEASQIFEEFKKQLFSNKNDSNQTIENNQVNDMASEMLQKAELIRTRLAELEAEINTFKKNNLELVKSKQEHELEKAHFEQGCLEAAEKLNDERIQMEIYLHDERMKIEDDRKKMEKQIRHQKSLNSGKEKKEIAKLQEEIDSLQKELKKKDEAHVAAQSRLRAQVRNLEKDVRQLNVEIDQLTKENKRLEMENVKLNGQNNNKMLQEINRNIAKLAPKVNSVTHMEEIPPSKTLNVSKHSKTKSALRRKSSESKRKPSPVKRQDSPVHSSEDDLSSASSEELNYGKANSKVTFAKSPTPPSRTTPTDKVERNESAPISTNASFKREIRNPDGSKDIWYPNGNLKKISSDGMIIRMLYFNKDIKETNINEGTVKYYYAETNTWHTTYLDGLEILEFPNGQTEHRYKDGKIEVHFPNNSIKITNPSDENKLEEWRFADGTNLIQMRNGDKILLMSNGQKEIHTAHNKRREYPDGTVKLLYPDGSQETRYSNGRVRLKDKDGNLVMDTENVQY